MVKITRRIRKDLACIALASCGVALAIAVAQIDARAEDNPWPGNYTRNADGQPDKLDRGLGISAPLTEAELLPALLSALDQLSRYPRSIAVPEITRIPQRELAQMVCGGPCAARAIYRTGEGIYLDDALQPETNLFDRSVLLHELVHYAQEMNGAFAGAKECERWYQREQEAYAIQKIFLIQVGSPVRVGYSAQNSPCGD